MNRVAGAIRTPDQRLRVFVSSTLKELAPERRAARAAIERLALAPVMFELGARPHPPRELYRAYLEQSDIFVGVYWEQYGWIAPGEEVSGLEDEWTLAPDIPKLIYLKRSEHRQERLELRRERIGQIELVPGLVRRHADLPRRKIGDVGAPRQTLSGAMEGHADQPMSSPRDRTPIVQLIVSPRMIPETCLPTARSSTGRQGTRLNSRLFSISA